VRVGAALVIGSAILAASAHAATPPVVQATLPAHRDAPDLAAAPLDIREARLGQRGLDLVLALRAQRPWAARQLKGGRSLCVLLGAPATMQLCVAARGARTMLVLQPVPADGSRHVVAATVTRPDRRTVRAAFPYSRLGLPLGPLRWAVRSTWQDAGACAAGCADAAPDAGAYRARLSAFAAAPCFAAAALDPRHSCTNRALDRVAYPRPSAAFVWPNAPCRPSPGRAGAILDPCAFGVGASAAKGRFALIGDSHATHWRGALEVLARALRWQGVSIARPGCPFSTQVPSSPSLDPGACLQLHAQILAWLRSHPDVHTVFTSNWAEPRDGPQGGTGGYGGGAEQYGALLDQLPASVAHVYAIRDVPRTSLSAQTCVRHRLAAHRSLRGRCWVPRSFALTPDPAAAAAAARGPRMRVLDLTRLFCSPARCPAVVGGAYVHKDLDHINDVFSRSLGPFVLRALQSPPSDSNR
jgi:SGNH domain (fused to AT3 domains)